MADFESVDDVDDLLLMAEALSDKLAVVAQSQLLRLIAIMSGLYLAMILAAFLAYVVFSQNVPKFRFGNDLYLVGPLMLVFVVYIGAALCKAFYRLVLDRMYIRLVRNRLEKAIFDAVEFQSSEFNRAP